jgi:hypothetical protein
VLGEKAVKSATKKQSGMISSAMDSMSADLDPNSLNDRALKFDLDRAKARLSAQKDLDPELYAQRQLSEKMLTGQLAELGQESSSDVVAQQAVKEAMQSGAGMSEAKQALIDAALGELKLGASLPPDVQAEIMKAGLETAGNVTGEAASRGAGANILHQTLGLGALNLKAQRQLQAEKMLATAGDLDAQRQTVLQSLFPNLQAQQLNKTKATAGFLQQADTMLPEAGLSGADITNLWLARTGALNQMAMNNATVKGKGALTAGLMNANTMGLVAQTGADAIGSVAGGIAGVPAGFSDLGGLLAKLGLGSKNPGIGASGNFAA